MLWGVSVMFSAFNNGRMEPYHAFNRVTFLKPDGRRVKARSFSSYTTLYSDINLYD